MTALDRSYSSVVKSVMLEGRSWSAERVAFGQRLRAAGLLGSMGRVGANERTTPWWSRFSGPCSWSCSTARAATHEHELASAIFEWIEGWYNPQRRHTSIDDLSPIDYERRLTTDTDAA